MLSKMEYVRQSVEHNLFFLRILKEHLIFVASALTLKNANIVQPAMELKTQLEMLLADVLSIANGVISPDAATSGEMVTRYTLKAEQVTEYFTGLPIDTNITKAEMALTGSSGNVLMPMLEQRVFMQNQNAIMLTGNTIQLKMRILNDVEACRMFTHVYPSMLQHVTVEARFYLNVLQKLQRGEKLDIVREALEHELFWNDIMGDHALFIRGMLDPSQEQLIATANKFGATFDELVKETRQAMEKAVPPKKVTEDSLKAVRALRDFKAEGTQGALDCKIKSVMLPLLADHVLREANHYLRLLKMYEKKL